MAVELDLDLSGLSETEALARFVEWEMALRGSSRPSFGIGAKGNHQNQQFSGPLDLLRAPEGTSKANPYHDSRGRFTTGPGGGPSDVEKVAALYPSPEGWTKRVETRSINDNLKRPFTAEELADLPEETRLSFTEKKNILIYEREGLTVNFNSALATPERGPNWTTPPESVEAALGSLSRVSAKNKSHVPVEVNFTTGTQPGGGGWTVALSNKATMAVDTNQLAYPKLTVSESGFGKQVPLSVLKSNPVALDYVLAHEWGHVLDRESVWSGGPLGKWVDELRISRYATTMAKPGHEKAEAFAEAFAAYWFAGDDAGPGILEIAKRAKWQR